MQKPPHEDLPSQQGAHDGAASAGNRRLHRAKECCIGQDNKPTRTYGPKRNSRRRFGGQRCTLPSYLWEQADHGGGDAVPANYGANRVVEVAEEQPRLTTDMSKVSARAEEDGGDRPCAPERCGGAPPRTRRHQLATGDDSGQTGVGTSKIRSQRV